MKKLILTALLFLVPTISAAEDELDFLRRSMERDLWQLSQGYPIYGAPDKKIPHGMTISPYQNEGPAPHFGWGYSNYAKDYGVVTVPTASANQSMSLEKSFILNEDFPEFDLDWTYDPYTDVATWHTWYDTLYHVNP